MWKIWYELPNGKSFSFTPRCGTSSIGLMAIKQFYPERLPSHSIINGDGHRLNNYGIGHLLPEDCAVMIREPVDRFRSLLGRMGITAEKAFCWLYWFHNIGEQPVITNRHDLECCAGTSWHHLTPLSKIVQQNSRLFLFPNFKDIINYLGLTGDIEKINICNNKVELTPEQEDKVRKIYADDIALWESLQ